MTRGQKRDSAGRGGRKSPAVQTQDNHPQLHASFGWLVPREFNIAEVCCGRWARQPDAARRIAVRAHAEAPP